MKLKAFDRVLLALLLIIAIVFSFILLGVATNIVQQDVAVRFVALCYANTVNGLIVAACGLVLLLLCLKLVFCGRGEKAPVAPASTLMQRNENGGTFISLEALDAMVKKHCSGEARVRDCHSTLQTAEDGVTIGLRLSVAPDTDVVSLASDLQTSLKAYIQGLTGINVKEVGVLIENTQAAPAAVSRVE